MTVSSKDWGAGVYVLTPAMRVAGLFLYTLLLLLSCREFQCYHYA